MRAAMADKPLWYNIATAEQLKDKELWPLWGHLRPPALDKRSIITLTLADTCMFIEKV